MTRYMVRALDQVDGVITKVTAAQWSVLAKDIIKCIDGGYHSFYAIVGSDLLDIVVKKKDDGTKYLDVDLHGTSPYNLEVLFLRGKVPDEELYPLA